MNLRQKADRLLRRRMAPLLLTLGLPLTALATPPAEVALHGYTENTFSSNFTSRTVDMNRTLNRGYKWYLADIYGKRSNPADIKINADGSVTMYGDNTGATGALMSVAPYRGTNSWVGTSFGGGAYIEAVFNYDPAQVEATHKNGWHAYPSFWSLAMEGNFMGSAQWPGQAKGYEHSVEVDFFEADHVTSLTTYGIGLHDWWGIPNKTCNPGLCKISPFPKGIVPPPKGTNFKEYHTYGFLWVPATATTEGLIDTFFDGKSTGYKLSWTKYTDQPPTPEGKSWAFGKTDQQHLFFILGTGTGETYQVKSVNVWQKSAAENLTN
jgi:hypothetical protein